jgi:chromosome segregation protein
VALAEQRSELLGARAQEIEAEVAAAPVAASMVDGREHEEALRARAATASTALAREQEALRSADEAARTLLRGLAETEARRTRLETELADAERRIAERAQEAQRLAAGRAAAAEAAAAGRGRLRAYGQRALGLQRQTLQLTLAAQEARRKREVAERQLEEQLRQAVEANDALRQATAAVQALEVRAAMLEAVLGQRADASSAARALLDAAQARDDGESPLGGIVGVVSSLLRVPEGLERAIEAALAEQISAVVVEHEADAFAAVAYLQEQGAGSLTVLPIEGLAHNYPLNLFNERGVIGVAARLVRVDQKYRPLIDTLLGRTIVVDSLAVARQMIERGLGSVVTKDGVLLRPGGAVYGGRGSGGAEQLGVRRELDALPEQIAEARRAEDAARARFDRAEPAVLDARDTVARARKAVDEAEERRREHERARTHLRRELVAIGSELRLAYAALASSGPDPAADASLRERPLALRAGLTAIAEEITTLRERADVVGAERDAVAQRVTVAATAVAAIEGEREAARSQREQRAEERRAAIERMEQRQALLGEVRREREDIALSLRDLRERLANNRAALAESERGVAPAHAALADTLGEQRELGATRGDAQARLFGAERETLVAEADLRQCAQQVQTLLTQIADEGLIAQRDGSVRSAAEAAEGNDAVRHAVTAVVAVPAAGGAEIDADALRTRVSDLRAEIRALGPVNIDALDDLSEERERHRFLTGQVSDLEAAEVELRGAIRDLEKLIRSRFDETFAQVNTNFEQYFQRFFGGGTATLRIVEPDEEGGEAGVEITAQPPGKRIASLNVLSGGERSLTSVALLFALLAVNPAPVCVLDEVDAALDEANVGRFVETLLELTARSQFIVITHNRRTVEAADTIYGVSMGDESTSQVLSLSVADLPVAS